MAIHEDHAVITVKGTCLCGCRFCSRSEGRIGRTVENICADRDAITRSHSATIMAGDLITTDIVPLVRLLRERGTDRIFVYAHPACSDIMPMKELHEAGLTGIHLVLPAADRQTLALVCGPQARLENAARLISGANALGMAVRLEIPVLEQNFESVPDTLSKALKLIQNCVGVEMPFHAIHDGHSTKTWDYRKATDSVEAAAKIARKYNIPLISGGSGGVPPCLIDVRGATPESYPELDSRIENNRRCDCGPLDACRDCAATSVCIVGLEGFSDEGRCVLPLAKSPEKPTAVYASELFIRKADLNDARQRAEQIDRCPAPWDSLEAHDRTGRTAPCEGSWPKREVIGQPDELPGIQTGWLRDGLLASYNSPFMKRMRQAMVESGRAFSCNRHCPRFMETWASRPAIRLPRTRVFADNLQKSLEEFISGAVELESRPLNITISPSLRCNQRCRMCDLTDPAAGEVGIDTPDAIFDELEMLLPTTATLALTGGEPLISRRIVDVISRITPRNLPDTMVTLTTNGTLLSPEIIDKFKPSNLSAVFISLNAATRDTHELITGLPGRFERVLENAAAMLDASRTMPMRPAVMLSFVVMRSNLRELPAFLEIASRIGTGIRLLPIERDQLGESIFTDLNTLEEAESMVRKLRDRYTLPGGQAVAELERLHGVIRLKMADDELSAL